ncbi:MAG: diacylglycerol kinase family lipid kinase [Bacteroidetes bacterium]|nr:diacylglycerol kinase family lipid kinase [Bacteroidota bacterium]
MNLSDSHFILINPTSSIGRSERKIKKLLKEFELAGLKCEYRISENIEAYYAYISEALSTGFKRIVTVGGDGSMHHTVNAVLKTPNIDYAKIKLGLISCGTGNDWIKSHVLPSSMEKMVKIIANDHTVSQEVGLIENENLEHYFINMAGMGFNGYLINKINHLKWFGEMAYFLGMTLGLFAYKAQSMRVSMGNSKLESNNFMVSVGIGKYAGGGMALCPNGDLRDGLLEITLIKDLNVLDFVFNIFSLKSGKFIRHPKVETYQTKSLTIEPLKKESSIFCEADGEFIGRGKTTFSISPHVLNIYNQLQ